MIGLSMYDDQHEVITNLRKALCRHRKVILCGSTGFGKTRIAKYCMGALRQKSMLQRHLFAVHRRGLVFNASRSFLNEDDQPALLTRDIIGEDRLMWGSDYPHTDSTWPCSAAVLDEMFQQYPAEAQEKITRTNVQKLYNL